MRGEHSSLLGAGVRNLGSSPHARGAQQARVPEVAAQGIIPACAGSTTFHHILMSFPRDHPRMRGEHIKAMATMNSAKGSSPHARGALIIVFSPRVDEGIIPACAGSTLGGSHGKVHQEDHPRMRGEHVLRGHREVGRVGSSPHARGAPVRHVGRDLVAGIIPACAGSTAGSRRGRTAPRDHPRMRGEHPSGSTYSPREQGSSPHARGALRRGVGVDGRRGIIPACAGSTSSAVTRLSMVGDHPRMRGEHCASRGGQCGAKGSSPHARGAPDQSGVRYAKPGIIPACAGST